MITQSPLHRLNRAFDYTAGLLFSWMYPAHFPAMLLCLEAWADTPEVTTAILKFAAEFVLNKGQRLTFDTSSANGILLFREVSQVCAHVLSNLCKPLTNLTRNEL